MVKKLRLYHKVDGKVLASEIADGNEAIIGDVQKNPDKYSWLVRFLNTLVLKLWQKRKKKE